MTGLRPGELIGLRWGDIWDDIVHIQRSINYLGEETKGKNENAVRNFVLTPSAKKEIQAQWIQSQTKEGPIFPVDGEHRSDQQEYHRRWNRYCRSNNLPKTSPYMLRHTFVSLAKNLPEGQVKALVGHSKNMDTLGVYAHEMKDDLQKTADSLESVIQDILASGL